MAKSPTHRSRAPSDDQEAAMKAARHAPVSLPSGGSYEVDTLQEGLDKATHHDGDKREHAVRKALDDARSDAATTSTNAPNALPGHKIVKTEVQLAPGTEVGEGKDKKTVGGVVVTEFRQVLHRGKDDDDSSALAPGLGGQAVTGSQSEVLSSETVEVEELPADTSVPAETGETGEPGSTAKIDGEPAGAAE